MKNFALYVAISILGLLIAIIITLELTKKDDDTIMFTKHRVERYLDPDNNVEYLLINGGITPRLNSHGTVIVWEEL